MKTLLEVKNVSRHYGGVKALQNVNLQVQSGEILGLIGPNGAGKTTLFNLITGMDEPDQGQIFLTNGLPLHGQAPHRISRLGVARTFQNIRLFKELTVLENVMLGAHYQQDQGRPSKTKRDKGGNRLFYALRSLLQRQKIELELVRVCLQQLQFFHLKPYKEEQGSSLPYGKQRELEVARALASKPQLLFLDEPAAGMNPSETKELIQNIRRINELGITVVLIEHDMHLVMQVCQRIVVLHQGQVIAEGDPQAIRSNPDVIEAYLGSTTQEKSC